MYVKLNLTVIMKSGYILEVSAIMGSGVGWGGGMERFPLVSTLPGKTLRMQLRNKMQKKGF